MRIERNLLTESEAIEVFGHLFDPINQIVRNSFDTVRELNDYKRSKSFKLNLPSVNAMEMYGCLVNNSINYFKDNGDFPNIKPVLHNNSRVFGLKYLDSAFIRFKKVDENFLPSQGITDQAKELNYQLPTEYFPSKPCIITIGYHVDKTWSELININMMCLKGREHVWNYPIDRESIPTIEIDFPEYKEDTSYSVEALIKTKLK